MDSFIVNNQKSPFAILGVSCVLLHFYFISDKKFMQANSEEPDQAPYSTSSDQVLSCLQKSNSGDARHERVNIRLGLEWLFDEIRSDWKQ